MIVASHASLAELFHKGDRLTAGCLLQCIDEHGRMRDDEHLCALGSLGNEPPQRRQEQ